MKIAVFLKWVLDCGVSLAVKNKEMIVEQQAQKPTWVVNPADRAALETARKIKEGTEGTQILAVSFGKPAAEEALYFALARGADRAILIEDDGQGYRDATFISEALSRLLADKVVDLILCGNVAADSFMGCVGPYVADKLSMPQITGAIHLEIHSEDGGRARVHRRLEKGGRQVITCPLPVLITVDPLIEQPKYASLYALSLSRNRSLERVPLGSLGITDTALVRTKILSIQMPRPRPKKTFIPDGKLSVAERMKLIASGGMTKKGDNKILTGSPEQIADGIFNYLKQKGFLH